MNSTELSEFGSWQGWCKSAVSKVPARPGVYALRLASPPLIGRLRGESDVIYIGHAGKGKGGLRGRLKQHLSPRSDVVDLGWRLPGVTETRGPLEFAWKESDSGMHAKTEEGFWLCRYCQEHLEFPPLNDQGSGRLVRFLYSLVPEPSPAALSSAISITNAHSMAGAEGKPIT